MAEIPALYSQRLIINRHQKFALCHPFVEAMTLTLVDTPITFLTQSFSPLLFASWSAYKPALVNFCKCLWSFGPAAGMILTAP
jgi:hypothetical protein